MLKGSKKNNKDKIEGVDDYKSFVDNLGERFKKLVSSSNNKYLLDQEMYSPCTRHEMWLLTSAITGVLLLEEMKRLNDAIGKLRIDMKKVTDKK